ncbi:MAG TPA: 30S ribosomal protein S20 [Alphaproteobacteria bacterium]|nr:small subunit ribosomal protein S20 [Alphaproteobacteria bacterium]HEX4890225.1 30S ribosomal protein S20 [Alphaproteobacteria bacterium]
MANNRQAKKRIRQTATRTVVNGARRSRVRSFVRQVEDAISKGDSAAAQAALKVVEPELMRGAQKGALKKRAASRKVSRLTIRVNALGA